MNLQKQLKYQLGLTDEQIEKTLKLDHKIVLRALRRTNFDKPRDLKYFKASLKVYSKPLIKVWKEEKALPIRNFEYIKQENDFFIKKLLSKKEASLIDCEVCGIVNWHGKLKHEWLVHKRSLADRTSCEHCKQIILGNSYLSLKLFC